MAGLNWFLGFLDPALMVWYGHRVGNYIFLWGMDEISSLLFVVGDDWRLHEGQNHIFLSLAVPMVEAMMWKEYSTKKFLTLGLSTCYLPRKKKMVNKKRWQSWWKIIFFITYYVYFAYFFLSFDVSSTQEKTRIDKTRIPMRRIKLFYFLNLFPHF